MKTDAEKKVLQKIVKIILKNIANNDNEHNTYVIHSSILNFSILALISNTLDNLSFKDFLLVSNQ